VTGGGPECRLRAHVTPAADGRLGGKRVTVIRVKSVAIALVAVAALACGCSASSVKSSATSTTSSQALATTLACQLAFGPGASQPDAALVGKTLTEAQKLAADSGQITRVVAENGSCSAVTADVVFRRVDLWVVNGQVVKAVREAPPGMTSPT
jgi:hypothetical protein